MCVCVCVQTLKELTVEGLAELGSVDNVPSVCSWAQLNLRCLAYVDASRIAWLPLPSEGLLIMGGNNGAGIHTFGITLPLPSQVGAHLNATYAQEVPLLHIAASIHVCISPGHAQNADIAPCQSWTCFQRGNTDFWALP